MKGLGGVDPPQVAEGGISMGTELTVRDRGTEMSDCCTTWTVPLKPGVAKRGLFKVQCRGG